jgi:hypothetical protein
MRFTMKTPEESWGSHVLYRLEAAAFSGSRFRRAASQLRNGPDGVGRRGFAGGRRMRLPGRASGADTLSVSCHHSHSEECIMIDAKKAVEIAKQQVFDMLEQRATSVEEIERDVYKDRDVWSITLSLPRDLNQVSAIARLGMDPLQYKRFLIDVETGALVAIRLRETASR